MRLLEPPSLVRLDEIYLRSLCGLESERDGLVRVHALEIPDKMGEERVPMTHDGSAYDVQVERYIRLEIQWIAVLA